MSFIHNPEIRKSLILWITLSVCFSAISALFGLQCFIVVTLMSIVYSFIHFYSTYKRYKYIYELSLTIDKILHGDYTTNFSNYSEGELSVLSNELQKMTSRLYEQTELLISEKKLLSDSIADISHQIRTPLTSLNIIVARLASGVDTEEQRISLIRDMLMLLSKTDWLISSLLKISKLDADTVKFAKQKIYITELIHEVSDTVAVQLDLKDISLVKSISDDALVECDLKWTCEALVNIVNNCMEHTECGGEIKILGNETPIYSEIIIADNGSGINEFDLPHIFERFYKGKSSSTSSVGIGLYLSRSIIQKQNGTIKAENNHDKGAKFSIRFYKSIT